jgi:hypothetical protein
LSAEKKLKEFLDQAKSWERLGTSIPGIYVLKLPPYKGRSSTLVVELNPVDENLKPMKRRGLVLRSTEELESFNELYKPGKICNLLAILEKINPDETQRRKNLIEL